MNRQYSFCSFCYLAFDLIRIYLHKPVRINKNRRTSVLGNTYNRSNICICRNDDLVALADAESTESKDQSVRSRIESNTVLYSCPSSKLFLKLVHFLAEDVPARVQSSECSLFILLFVQIKSPFKYRILYVHFQLP